MTRCNLAKQCDFFAVRDEGAEMREYLTGLYCAGNFRDCARYRAALDMGELAPTDIFPNEDAFLSLFAWAVSPEINTRYRIQHSGKPPVSPPEKTGAPCGHLPATRQTRSQR